MFQLYVTFSVLWSCVGSRHRLGRFSQLTHILAMTIPQGPLYLLAGAALTLAANHFGSFQWSQLWQ